MYYIMYIEDRFIYKLHRHTHIYTEFKKLGRKAKRLKIWNRFIALDWPRTISFQWYQIISCTCCIGGLKAGSAEGKNIIIQLNRWGCWARTRKWALTTIFVHTDGLHSFFLTPRKAFSGFCLFWGEICGEYTECVSVVWSLPGCRLFKWNTKHTMFRIGSSYGHMMTNNDRDMTQNYIFCFAFKLIWSE